MKSQKANDGRRLPPRRRRGGFLTGFAERVLIAVRNIPRGKVLTYKEVAKLAGRSNAYRAVGNILKKNYNPNIPCHRVVRSDGKLGGYNRGANKKITLLKKEGVKL
jgi:O-6-methylguanine DNA methyltransferase